MIIKKWLLIIGLSMLTGGTNMVSAANELDYTITTDFYTKYIWRGQVVSDKSVFEPSIAVRKSRFSALVWGNMDLTGQNEHRNEFIEMDYVLDYTSVIPDINRISYSIGAIHYDFPNTWFKSTTEIYGGLTLAVPLNPYIKIYRDVDETKGSYIQVGAGHTIDKFFKISEDCYCGLRFGGSLSYGNSEYNKFYFGSGGGKLNDLNISLAAPVCVKNWIITPVVYYSTMVNSQIRAATNKSDNLVAGISISKSF